METKTNRVPLPMSEPGVDAALTPPPESGPGPNQVVDVGEIQEKIIEALKGCFDPEIPVNIYELGLIYGIDVEESGAVNIRMTLTSPMCPAAGSLPPEVQAKTRAIPGVSTVKVDLVWDPPWSPERMSEAARVQLGMF